MRPGLSGGAGPAGAVERVVFDAEQIARRVAELGADISATYGPEDRLLMIGLLKGCFIFMADLVRAVTVPHQVEFLVASSYGNAKASSGEVRLLYDPRPQLEGRAVVLVDDIVDSGTTLAKLRPELQSRGPASVEVCALLHKKLPTSEPEPRWIGFDAPNDFLVGYGLDHAEDFRHLPYIASLRTAPSGSPE